MYDAALQTQTSTKGVITKSIHTKIESSGENGSLVGIHFTSFQIIVIRISWYLDETNSLDISIGHIFLSIVGFYHDVESKIVWSFVSRNKIKLNFLKHSQA